MDTHSTDPRSLTFWKKCLKKRTLLRALEIYPEQAKNVFGALPVMRKNVLQLGLILAAREVLAERPGRSKLPTDLRNDKQLRALIAALPPEKQSFALQELEPQKQEKCIRDLARAIVKEATGEGPRQSGSM